MGQPVFAPDRLPDLPLATLADLRGGGTYVLWLHLPLARRLEVGALGEIDFAAGYYGYVGSAHGPGGLAARVGRHLKGGTRLRWHIDYLRRAARPVAVWYDQSTRRREHEWAAALITMAGTWIPAPGFGASDCACPAHLFGFAVLPAPELPSAATLRCAGHLLQTSSPSGSSTRALRAGR